MANLRIVGEFTIFFQTELFIWFNLKFKNTEFS